ncbi:MAG TPA: hypothetical protein VFH68_08030 [Polyangia bacterium]|nr:hypothetical protein [Polyangia bacterium]
MSRTFDILGAPPADPVRASFRDINMVPVALGAVGDAATRPQAVFGGDLLRAFSVEFRFGVPSLTFWSNQRADDGFLEDVGYAVIHFTPFGGGEITAHGRPDFLGQRAPLDVEPSRIVFRACVAPAPFDPATSPREACCDRGDAITHATGTPLSLLLATGVGPLVLSRSAWERVRPQLGLDVPVETPGQLYLASAATPLSVSWALLPPAAHLALVNQESSAANDPGPCVELARARRIEWVAYRQVGNLGVADCVQACDTDPNDTQKAQNSAAYIEVGGVTGSEIAVAILPDTDPLLEGLRSDVRPEGPELDGIIGAGALARTRLEVDYRNSSMRAIFSCDGTSDRDQCFTGARCPRLPDHTQQHACFGLPLAGLPAMCAADPVCGN